MATAQPISLPHADPQDFPMGSGSFTGQNGSFNASSLTRHLIGTPLSFRSGSFGSRFYPGMSPGQLLGPLDPNEFKFGKMSSSIESDRGSIVNALAMLDRQDELCRDYTCCGLNLTDLHALVDHFEECHVVVLDPYAPQQSHPALPNTSSSSALSSAPQAIASYYPDSGVPSTSSHPHAHAQSQQHNQNQHARSTMSYQGFDPADDMELDVDQSASAPSSGAPSPPDTPISTPMSGSGYASPGYSAAASPHASQPASPISAFETTTVLPSRAHATLAGFRAGSASAAPRNTEDAFNAYAGYADYSSLLPGANAVFMQGQGVGMNGSGPNGVGNGACAPTALLLSSSAGNTPDSTPASSRVASPIPGSSRPIASSSNNGASSSSAATARASTTLSRPASSLLLSKPFKCPKPNCNKSYKQANGLKYHMTHGSCNFAPPKDLEHLQELLASKRSEKARAAGLGENGIGAGGMALGEGEVTLSEAELREVEKEAERRLRPYACSVGECQRRYKNMNGLRYHYQHSGDHGAIGLALLASGQHECLQHNKSRHATPSHSASNSISSPPTPSASAAPSATQQAQQPRTPVNQAYPAYQTSSAYSYQQAPSHSQYAQAYTPPQSQQHYSMMQQ